MSFGLLLSIIGAIRFSSDDLYVTVLSLGVLVYAVIFHEVAHAVVAHWNGDPTAKLAGRITLNPLPHIDPMGSILVPLISYYFLRFPFGWARPVPVNPLNYRRRVSGDITVSLAGVSANLLFAVVLSGLLHLTGAETLNARVLSIGITLNCALLFFNLLPVPPLDGSHIFKYLLPGRLRQAYVSLGMFGFFILLIIFFSVQGVFGVVKYVVAVVLFITGHGWLLGGE